jgi:Uma2 family endonuclease
MAAMLAERRPLTPAEYLERERYAKERSEFAAGELFATAGGKKAHNLIALSFGAELRSALRDRPCLVFPSDMKVRVSDAQYVYPDCSAVCGDARFEHDDEEVLLNPEVIVEVLSPSTEAYDRGDKSQLYRALPGVRELLLASSSVQRVEHFVRQPDDSWLLRVHEAGASLRLVSLDVELALDELYRKAL